MPLLARSQLVLVIAWAAALAAAPAALGQEPPPDLTTPSEPPPVTLEEPEPAPVDTTEITIHVPQPKPAPRPRVEVNAKVAAPVAAKRPTRREEPEPAVERPHVERPDQVEASQNVVVERPKPAPRATARRAKRAQKVVVRVDASRRLERGLAERVSESWASSEADHPVPTAAVLGITAGNGAPFAGDGSDGGQSPFVVFLAALGLATLTFAGAMPLLAAYSPETFVPVLRLRRDVSFVGFCLLGAGLTGLLAAAVL